MSKMLSFNSIQVGDELPAVVRECAQENIWRYAAGSLDFNPVHTDPEWVRTAQPFGIPQTVAHGMFTMSSQASVVSDWAYPSQGVIRSIDSKFIKPVSVGSIMKSKGTVSSKHFISPGKNYVVVELKTENQDGELVAIGQAEVIFPD